MSGLFFDSLTKQQPKKQSRHNKQKSEGLQQFDNCHRTIYSKDTMTVSHKYTGTQPVSVVLNKPDERQYRT